MRLHTIVFLICFIAGLFLFGQVATAYYQSFSLGADFETIAVRGCINDWSASKIKQRIKVELGNSRFLLSDNGLQLDRTPPEWGKPCKSLLIEVSYQRELSLLGQDFQVEFQSSASNSTVSPLASSKTLHSLIDH